MGNKELLSIKEFAAAAGKSEQAIYKQLNNKLQTYLVIVENKKMLKIQALKDIYNIEVEQPVEQLSNNQLNQKLIDMLQKELDEKNKQIAELQKLIDQEQQLRATEHKRILELEDKLQQPIEQPIKKRWQFWK